MVFDLSESVEDEDYYTVTLSFRPELGFTGTPGQEQFSTPTIMPTASFPSSPSPR